MTYTRFAALCQIPPHHGPAWTVAACGRGPVLFTAPHAVPHARMPQPGQPIPGHKLRDSGTGQLAWALAEGEAYGPRVASVLVARAPWPGNANHDLLEACPFKQAMVGLIQAGAVHTVLDLHGMHDEHGIEVCLGTGRCEPGPLLGLAIEELDRAGLSWQVDDPFDGSGAGRVNVVARQAGAAALQIELARCVRDPQTSPERTQVLYDALARLAVRAAHELG